MSNEDKEQKYEESIKNLQNIINKVKETNLEEDSSSNNIYTDNSVSNEKIEKKIIKRKVSKPSPNKQNSDNLESEDIINSTSVIDEEDAEKLSFDKLEIKEEENYFSLDNDSSKSFEDNINNKSSEKSKNITTDHLENPSDEDLDKDSDDLKVNSIFNIFSNSKNEDKSVSQNIDFKSHLISIIGIIVGAIILFYGAYLIYDRSARVVDSVASGESSGLAIFLIFIGAISIVFSILQIVSFKTPFDNFAQSIRNIDSEEDEDPDMDELLSKYSNVDLDKSLSNDEDTVKSDLIDEYGNTKSSFDSEFITNHPDDEYKITVKTHINDED